MSIPVPSPPDDYEPRRRRSHVGKIVGAVVISLLLGGVYASYTTYLSVSDSLLRLSSKSGLVTTDVNIRTSPGAGSPRIGIAPKGTRVRIVNSRDNWYEIEADGMKGWVNGRFIRVE
jgi:uncharacterized protein YgiM (DUF1202 family)